MADTDDTPVQTENQTRDLGFNVIVGFIVLIAGWLLLMPWMPNLAKHSLERFHLRTPFAIWAVSDSAMYNLANQYKIDGATRFCHDGSR